MEQKNNDQKELLDRFCAFIERMIDKKTAADAEAHKDLERHQSRNVMAGFLLIAVTLATGAGGIIYKAHAENRDRDESTLREANRRKLEIIGSISAAITDMREVYETYLMYCKTGITAEKKLSLEQERIHRRFALVRVGRPMLHFFNNKFRELIRNFTQWEEAIADYCATSAPSETVWRQKQKEIEDQMVLSPPQIFADN